VETAASCLPRCSSFPPGRRGVKVLARALQETIDGRLAGVEELCQFFLRARLRPLRCSISQRPAGPGGASLRYTARIGINGFRLSGGSIRITRSLPLAMSSSTMNRGMLPKPNPARRKACRAPISASRQTFFENTVIEPVLQGTCQIGIVGSLPALPETMHSELLLDVPWSTLPNVETISRGKLDVPHFTGKAKIDRIVREAGFAHHTFVIAPFFYQNLLGAGAPQKQADGTMGWVLPLDPEQRVIHMGDITELGPIVVGAFARPELAGHGEHLPLVGDFMSFNEILATLNRQGHKFSFKQVPHELFAGFFPGAEEVAAMFSYFEAHTYLGSDSRNAIALANKVAGRQPTKFAAWARANFTIPAAA
jgi:hypothetical protein